jgi:magnesium-protoporphyrin O-methyltransferase
MSCRHTSTADKQFDANIARRDLKRFRRRGPDGPTRRLLAAVQDRPLPAQPSLLDVGGGIGAIHHVLLDRGFVQATQIDASAAYLAVATAEAARLGHGERVRFQHGDFVAAAPSLPSVDVVTLDRVVCCDANYAGILGAAADHARHLVAFSYPRSRWAIRGFVALANAARRVARESFRAYVHPPRAMAAVLEGAGMRRAWAGGTWIWAVEVFERAV